jgi:allophanate hydrolase
MSDATADPEEILLAVAGAHLAGQPLNGQLTDRGARLVATTTTAPTYRLFALPTDPPKPGLVRVAAGDPAGRPVEVEVWALAPAAFASFVDAIPAPLGIGRVVLADGTDVAGFLCEPLAVEDPAAVDITAHGGWRAYRGAAPD